MITQAKYVAQGLGHNQCSVKFSYHLRAHLISSAGLTQLTFHLEDGDLSRGTKWKPGTDHRATAHVSRWLLCASGRKALGACLTSEVSKSQRTSVVLPLAQRSYTAVPGENLNNKKPPFEGFASARPCAKLRTSGIVCSVPSLLPHTTRALEF